MWHMGDGWGWWMVFGTIIMIAFWLMLVWAISSLGEQPTHPTEPPRQHEEPGAIQILEGRFAEGELTNEEFEEKRRLLLTSPSSPQSVADQREQRY